MYAGFCLFIFFNWGTTTTMNSRKLIGEKMNVLPKHLFFLFRFARLAANTFISQGVPVYLFSDITPTPFVVGFSIMYFYMHTNSVRHLALLILKKTRQTAFNFLSSTCC